MISSMGKESQVNIETNEIPQDTLIELEEYTTKEKNVNVFFSINDTIQKLLDETKKETVYYYAQEIYKIQTYQKATYYTYGLIQKENKGEVEEYYLKVNVDITNNTFFTEELSEKEYNEAKDGKINKIEFDVIKKSDNNQYELKNISSEEIARRYVKDYILKVKYMPDKAFELLYDDYKNEKFKNSTDFKEYVQKNSARFNNLVIQKYQCEVKEEYLEYTVMDQYNNYYKIIVYSALDYKIVLDNYTLEEQEYIEKYNNASEQEKVAICISKFIKLINSKEYEEAYKKLDTTFKKNKFDSVEKFKNYIKNELFNYNIATIQSEDKIGDVYTCKVKIKSGVGVSAEEKEITVVMKLLEGTDFVMSFNVE